MVLVTSTYYTEGNRGYFSGFLLENTLIPTQDKPLNLIIDTNTLGQKLKISILKPEVNLV